MNPARLLDPNRIQILIELGGEDFLLEVLDIFVRDGQPLMSKLGEHSGASDHASLAALAHQLRSSSSNIGALTLAQMAKELETSGDRIWIEKMTLHFADLCKEISHLKLQLKNKSA